MHLHFEFTFSELTIVCVTVFECDDSSHTIVFNFSGLMIHHLSSLYVRHLIVCISLFNFSSNNCSNFQFFNFQQIGQTFYFFFILSFGNYSHTLGVHLRVKLSFFGTVGRGPKRIVVTSSRCCLPNSKRRPCD